MMLQPEIYYLKEQDPVQFMHTFEYRDAAAVCLGIQLQHAQDGVVKRNKCYFTILIIYQSRIKRIIPMRILRPLRPDQIRNRIFMITRA
jgi:hypothetical protein